jgi:hypothetical protein
VQLITSFASRRWSYCSYYFFRQDKASRQLLSASGHSRRQLVGFNSLIRPAFDTRGQRAVWWGTGWDSADEWFAVSWRIRSVWSQLSVLPLHPSRTTWLLTVVLCATPLCFEDLPSSFAYHGSLQCRHLCTEDKRDRWLATELYFQIVVEDVWLTFRCHTIIPHTAPLGTRLVRGYNPTNLDLNSMFLGSHNWPSS